jgi:hypothetical protein
MSHNPMGLHGLLQGYIYLYFLFIVFGEAKYKFISPTEKVFFR